MATLEQEWASATTRLQDAWESARPIEVRERKGGPTREELIAQIPDTPAKPPEGEDALGGTLSPTGAPRLTPRVPRPILEFGTGLTGTTRGTLNLARRGLGDRMFPPTEGDSGFETAGRVLDPAAMAIAATAGRIAPFVPLMEKGLRGLPAALGRNVASGGATGGVLGGLSDEGDAGSGAAWGFGLGAVLPPALSGVARAGRSVLDYIKPPPGVIGNMAAGDKAPDVIAAMRRNTSNVPGYRPTAGQAAVPANSAEFSALQREVESLAPSRYSGPQGVRGQQEAAHRAAAQSVGKTPAELESAIAQRKATSSANYEEAFSEVVKRDKDLRELWKNPYFKDEVGEAWKLLRSDDLKLKGNLTQFLHHVKEGLDARLQAANNPNAPAISNATKKAIVKTKAKLLEWLEARNPAYETARLEHIELSKPINQMKLGQEVERAMVAPASGAERPGVFANAVQKAETTVSKSTGRPRIEDVTPQQRSIFDAILGDLKNDAQFRSLAQAGAKNLESRIGAPEVPPTGMFQPMLSAARGWINRALGAGRENALRRLAPIMDDPQKMAQLMEAATPQQRQQIRSLMAERGTRGAIYLNAQTPDGQLSAPPQ